MPDLRIYDPDEVIVNAGGVDIGGYFSGTFVTVTSDSDAFNVVVGNQGDVVRSKTRVETATVTVTLLQTSPSNDILSALHNLDLVAPNGAGVFNLTIRDSSTGRARYEAAKAWIQKAPDANFGSEDLGRAWTIRASRMVRFDGGVG